MVTIRKSIAAALTGIATWGITAQPDGIDSAEWWGLFGVLVGAFLVWLVPNEPEHVDIAERLAAVGLYDDEPTTPERGAVDLVGALYLVALVIVILCGLKFLGAI